MVFMLDLWNFIFFGRGDVSPTHSELCRFVMGLQAPVILLLKNFLFPSAIAMSWQDMTPSSLCSGVKECGTKHAYNFIFPKSSFRIRRTTVLGMFKDSAIILMQCNFTVIFDQISDSSNVYLSLSRFWTATSIIIFYQIPSNSKSRIPPKNI